MRRWWPSIRSPTSRWSGSGSCRSIRWNRYWRQRESEGLLGFLFFLRRAGSHQSFQFPVQAGAAVFVQFQEAERLETSFGRPHGKQHLRAAADAGAAEVEQESHADAFVERVFERDQTAVAGELIHAAADLTPVFEDE